MHFESSRMSADDPIRPKKDVIMTKHIGILSCTTEGAALCYRLICSEGEKYLGEYAHPEITLHAFPLADYKKHYDKGDWKQT